MELSKNSEKCQNIHVAHSPDPDDRFMFWPLLKGLISHPFFEFSFEECDTATLNQIATNHAADICAVSAIHYGRIWNDYQPLVTGSSVGDGYGPVVVVSRKRHELITANGPSNTQDQARLLHLLKEDGLLLTPGASTTAHAVLSTLGYNAKRTKAVSISPIEKVFEELHSQENQGVPTAALIIHEGRLIYENFDCVRILDIGHEWRNKTNASLPLGINVISRKIPLDQRKILSQLLTRSCQFAVQHVREFFDYLATLETPIQSRLSRSDLEKYLALYANETTVMMKPQDRSAFADLIRAGHEQHLFASPTPPIIDWI